MTDQPIISDENDFKKNATEIFETMFKDILSNNLGEIEIKALSKSQGTDLNFCRTVEEAVECAYNLCNSGYDVYFGANPRKGGQGKKENVHYLIAFHLDIDYGIDGHNKESEYKTYEEALDAIKNFEIEPSIVNHTGGGFHCLYLLKEPVRVEEIGLEVLEDINKAILKQVGGDPGTHYINIVLRVPGTFNFKLENKPRLVKIIQESWKKYDLKDFQKLIENKKDTELENKKKDIIYNDMDQLTLDWDKGSIDDLPVSPKIKSLILNGNDGSYSTKSEADMAVITSLFQHKMSFEDIKYIFQKYAIGDKYRKHGAPDSYLKHSIHNAKKILTNLMKSYRIHYFCLVH